jgi:hypothetical protein
MREAVDRTNLRGCSCGEARRGGRHVDLDVAARGHRPRAAGVPFIVASVCSSIPIIPAGPIHIEEPLERVSDRLA